MLLFVITVALSLVFSFLCSIAEATLLSVGRARVEALAAGGSWAGTRLRRFRLEPDRPIAAVLIVNTIANSGGAALATDQFVHAFPGVEPAWFAALFVISVLTMTEIVPKTIGVIHADRLAIPVTVIVVAMTFAVWPLLRFTGAIGRMIRRHGVGATISLEEIRVLTSAGYNQGAFGPITAELIQNATRLRETKARDVMVPRDRVTFLSATASMEVNLRRIRKSGHSRFPFTPTGELDDVTGVILAKELLFALRDVVEPDWNDLLVPLQVVPETAALNHVLRRFQHSRRHLAIVVDEYGSMQGIVTLEDVLEEIVGEIEDESDTSDKQIVARPDGSLHCRGSAEVADVFERLGLSGVATRSKTLSGLLAEQLGTVPSAGDTISLGGHTFEVVKANNRRAQRVVIRPGS